MKKKILLTSLSGQLGGLELRLQQEAHFLKEIGFNAEIAINPFPEVYPWVDRLEKEGIPFHFFDPPPFFEQWQWRRFNKIRAQLFHTSMLNNSEFDLVNVAMAWTDTAGTRLYLAQQCGLPTVISVHNAFRDQKFSQWQEELLSYGFQSVKGIYAVSDSALERFLALFSRFINKKVLVEVINNPVDTQVFKPSAQFSESNQHRGNSARTASIPSATFRIGTIVGSSPSCLNISDLLCAVAPIMRESVS